VSAWVGWFKNRPLRWEWRVYYSSLSASGWTYNNFQNFSSRLKARMFIRTVKTSADLKFVKFERRLVSKWEHYRDSFGWNRGNGKR
jgi:hypothetical protein